jgi:hypothetical protein
MNGTAATAAAATPRNMSGKGSPAPRADCKRTSPFCSTGTFPKDREAIEQLLTRLEAIELDWTTVQDWQLVELAREAIDCCRHNAAYDLEVPTPSPSGASGPAKTASDSATSSDYVIASSLLLRRHDDAPSRLIH